MEQRQSETMERQTKNENRWKECSFITSVQVLEETDSTNRVAKQLAQNGAKEGTLVVAKRQSMGKGRLGRSFFSPEGGIYMSMVLRPEIAPEKAVLITTCAAVAVARAIGKVCGLDAGIALAGSFHIGVHIVLGERVRFLHLDDRGGNLAEARIGKTDHRHILDRGMGTQEILDLHGIEVLAARDDNVLRPVDQIDEAVLIHLGNIARVEPTVA